jgi:predicted polyphosphate/ATP-dependent NAD kinase
MFKLGLIINPLAGVGGPLGLKGSDGSALVSQSLEQGAQLRAGRRTLEALKVAETLFEQITVCCPSGSMGADVISELGVSMHIVGSHKPKGLTQITAEDTMLAAQSLKQQDVDLVMFAGGDGTARDIFTALGSDVLVLGIPAGVKMHSGVYAVSPQAAGEILVRMITGQLVDVGLGEVRDIDEQAFRQNVVRTEFYGELLVPSQGQFLQQVKSSGREVEALVLADIAADIVESMDDEYLYLIGPGSTPRAIMEQLGLDNTLLGVDAVVAGKCVGYDLNEQEIISLIDRHSGPVNIVVTAIGGQGHIFGRGNQQFSPLVINAVGIDNIIIVATKTKISALEGRPLLVDTNDPELDAALTAYRKVITGYHDAIVYPVGLGVVQELLR